MPTDFYFAFFLLNPARTAIIIPITTYLSWEGVHVASRQFVIFNLNQENFGVEITEVKEIIKPVQIYKVPNTPEYIEGLINLRGKVHTVFNLRKKFSLPAREFDDNTKIIVVNVNSIMVGFIVDEVNEIIRVEDEDIEAAPQDITALNRRYISGIAKISEKIVILLDLARVLSAEEAVAAEKVSE